MSDRVRSKRAGDLVRGDVLHTPHLGADLHVTGVQDDEQTPESHVAVWVRAAGTGSVGVVALAREEEIEVAEATPAEVLRDATMLARSLGGRDGRAILEIGSRTVSARCGGGVLNVLWNGDDEGDPADLTEEVEELLRGVQATESWSRVRETMLEEQTRREFL